MSQITFGQTPAIPKRCYTCKRPEWTFYEGKWICIKCDGRNPMILRYGPGPDALCRTCTHLIRKHYDKVYYKCELRGNTNGPGTDHRVRWPACVKYQPETEE